MAAVMFDTLKMSKALSKSFPPDQAVALTEAFSESLIDTVATKADVLDSGKDLRVEIAASAADLKAEIAASASELRAEIAASATGLKAEIQGVRLEIRDVRVEIRDMKVDLVRWIVGAIAFNLLATVGLMITLIKLAPR